MRQREFAAALPLLEWQLAGDTDGSVHVQLSRALAGLGQQDKADALLARVAGNPARGPGARRRDRPARDHAAEINRQAPRSKLRPLPTPKRKCQLPIRQRLGAGGLGFAIGTWDLGFGIYIWDLGVGSGWDLELGAWDLTLFKFPDLHSLIALDLLDRLLHPDGHSTRTVTGPAPSPSPKCRPACDDEA